MLLASGRARIALLPLCGRVERPNRTRALRSRNRPGDQVLSMALVSAETGHVHKVVYTSPALDKYKFDNFKGYSPPIAAAATGLALDNSEPLFIQLTVANNQRNLQIPLDPKAGLSVKVKVIYPRCSDQSCDSGRFLPALVDSEDCSVRTGRCLL